MGSALTSDTALSWAAITISAIAFIFLWWKVKTALNKVFLKKEMEREEDEGQGNGDMYTDTVNIQGTIDLFNLNVNRFNDLITEYPMMEKVFREKAVEFQDRDALSYITRSSMAFSEKMETAGNLAACVRKASESGNTAEMSENAVRFAGNVDDMEKILEQTASYTFDGARGHVSGQDEKPPGNYKKSSRNVFFEGCLTKDELEKRYRALCKAYHPDQGYGDRETFRKVQEEYTRMKTKLIREGDA